MLKRNLTIYPYALFSLNFYIWCPLLFLYFLRTLSLTELFFLDALYQASSVLLEWPSGYLSDLWGRKKTLFLAAFCQLAAGILFYSTHHFWSYALGQIFLGANFALISGTDTSL
jgi:MFS family permease